jgi:hypothetical protein
MFKNPWVLINVRQQVKEKYSIFLIIEALFGFCFELPNEKSTPYKLTRRQEVIFCA